MDIQNQIQNCLKAIKTVLVLVDFVREEKLRDEFKAKVERIKLDLEGQKKEHEKTEFEIAVIGPEKNGRSTLINSWMKFSLLPVGLCRCTLTFVEIRSCKEDSEQCLCVEYFSEEEFEEKLHEIRENANKDEEKSYLFNNELRQIEEKKDNIYSHLGKPNYEKKFTNFEDVEKEIRSVITDPNHAGAVKKICITTPRLCKEENVVFYDMPGYNSPITLHKDQTREKLANVDVILVAKELERPSLYDIECQILQITNELNEYITTREKVVVALTCFDKANSVKDYQELLKKSQQEWEKQGVSSEKLVPVCALAEFDTYYDAKQVKRRIESLGKPSSGIQELKRVVSKCALDSRERIAIKRCIASKNRLSDFWTKDLCPIIKRDYDVLSEVQFEMNTMNETELKTFIEKWNSIMKNEFQNFFIEKIFCKENENELITTYEKVVEESFNRMRTLDKSNQLKVYAGLLNNEGLVSPIEGNTAIRKQLNQEAIAMLDDLAGGLSDILWSKYNEMIEWISGRIREMRIETIRKITIGPNEELEKEKLKASFDALIKRLVQPAIDIFLRFPRSKAYRKSILNEFQIELEILDKFIIEGSMTKRGLFSFVANGTYDVIEPQLKDDLKFDDYASDFESIHQEIKNDANEFLAVLKNSVFYGSGLVRFFNQELDEMRIRFMEFEKRLTAWTQIVEKKKEMKVDILSEIKSVEKLLNQ